MAWTGLASLSAKTRSSPLAEKFSPSLAESARPRSLGAQEQLVGPHRAGRQDDDVRLDAPARCARPRQILHHDLPAALRPGDRLGPAFAEHRCAVVDGVGDVGDAHGVLGADVAARPAVAAVPAGVLHHAGNVGSRLVGDRHRRQLHRTARCLRRPAHARELGKALGGGHRRDAQHGLRPRQPLLQEAVADHRIRPAGLAQSAEIGPQRDTGVDQRPAA